MPKNSGAARREQARALAAAESISYTAALAWLTGCALSIATTPNLTGRLFLPGARFLGLHPRPLIVLTTLGSSVLWPVAAVLLCAARFRKQP